MPHQLKFRLTYKSITSFSTVKVPDFCLVTGKNGSGKSHLLEAIEKGAIETSATKKPNEEIARFDGESIIPKDTGNYSPAQALQEQFQRFTQIRNKVPSLIPQFQNDLKNWGLDASRLISINDVIRLADEDTFCSEYSQHQTVAVLYSHYKLNLSARAAGIVQVNSQNDNLGQRLRELAQIEPVLILTGSESKIFEHEIFEKTEVGTFQQAFAKTFTDYRKRLISNLANQLEDNKNEVLSDEQFVSRFGPEPWKFVNEILEISSLDFRINRPVLNEPYGSFETRLAKVSTGVEVKFADLSSGERVLMSFALCLYNSAENTGSTTFPKLLLLDEIDAHLHPDMVKFVLKTIREVLVKKHQISVIFTTHSPTTVALFDKEGIFEMQADGPSLRRISRDRALSILTAGVPTVSISYNQINQVFVESETDAVVLSELYQILKSSLSTERSVQFIKSGRKSNTGNEENAGCARVKSVVRDLRNAGVNTVFGLVDWDGINDQEEGIIVLCHKTRYSIENLILDPVILIAKIAKEHTDFAKLNNFLTRDETFVGLPQWNQDRWQTVTDNLMKIVGMEAEKKTTVDYQNGMTLEIARPYLEKRGHDLAALVVEMIPPLKGIQDQGKLESYIARNIVPEVKDLLPNEILTLFERLTELGPH